ncbi:A/G-specific adenine glycosylase [Celeribacter sp.]|uniref:A/G-specific adenine glycosylase n=1 Tax=Celeribacter sp. TaxID=1890673 RepID=UPI003A904A2E
MRDDLKCNDITGPLLAWYDAHARVLPWRIAPQDRARGIIPDPYRVWLSEIMLQQTTVAAVKAYFERFTALWPTVADLAAAPDDAVMAEWAGLGYYARARNLLKCARVIVAEHGGAFPNSHATLLTLPGIGPYTASAVSAIAFDAPETVLDGNVERVMSRLFLVEIPLPTSKPELMALATRLTPTARAGDYAQAVMDLGATVCTPKSPACDICPLVHVCRAHRSGVAAQLPKKVPKKPKPVRLGHVYVTRTAAKEWVLEKRPEKGLLGGMLGWPTSEWNEAPSATPPYDAPWHHVGEVRHTFTHFHLILSVHVAPCVTAPEGTVLVPQAAFRPSDLPTLMRKAFDLAQATFDNREVGSAPT